MNTKQSIVSLAIFVSLSSIAAGQVTAGPSGVSGDGIPDLFYHVGDGVLTIETDGVDMKALLLSDPNASFFGGCLLCDGDFFEGRGFAVDSTNGITAWFQSFPLGGPGLDGIYDLAVGSRGLSPSYFVQVFDDAGAEALWNFRMSTDSSGQFFSDVTFAGAYRTDFNGDNDSSVADLDILTMLGDLTQGVAANGHEFDLIRDGVIDNQDVDQYLRYASPNSQSPLLRGDANLDGTVDAADFIAWNQNKFSAADRWSEGDFNGDGFVDGNDFLLWNANKFQSVDAVPEPVTCGIATFAGIMLVIGRRRRGPKY